MSAEGDSSYNEDDEVSKGRSFSQEWYRFYDEVGAPTDHHRLVNIEKQLANYEAAWRSFPGSDAPSLDDTDDAMAASRTPAEILGDALFHLGLVQRIVLSRSVVLYKAFIRSLNQEDYDSCPLLLRAIMEQGAFGVHTARQIRHGFEAYRAEGPNARRDFLQAIRSAVFGAKINMPAFFASLSEEIPTASTWIKRGELDHVMKLMDNREFSEKTVPREAKGSSAASVSSMIDALDAEHLKENFTPELCRTTWEWLSQYCHPSYFSWQFHEFDVLQGGLHVWSEDERSALKFKALIQFIEIMSGLVRLLPGFAIDKLFELESEITQERDALRGSS